MIRDRPHTLGWMTTGEARGISNGRLTTFEWPFWLLIVLLILDALFIQLHRLFLQNVLDARFALTSERSYPEYYEHAKEMLLVVFAGTLVARYRERLYACWTALFAYLLLDDTFELHERIGAVVSGQVRGSQIFGMPADAAGELVPSAVALLVLVIALAVTWRSASAGARRFTVRISAAVVALGGCGVLLDVIHAFVRRDPWRYRLGMVEEGGEMLVMTVMVCIVAMALRQTDSGGATIAYGHAVQ
jgi:hypothetical protein